MNGLFEDNSHARNLNVSCILRVRWGFEFRNEQ